MDWKGTAALLVMFCLSSLLGDSSTAYVGASGSRCSDVLTGSGAVLQAGSELMIPAMLLGFAFPGKWWTEDLPQVKKKKPFLGRRTLKDHWEVSDTILGMAETSHSSLCLNVRPLMEKMMRLKEQSLSWKVASQAFSNTQFQMPRRAAPQASEVRTSNCWWWGRFFKMGTPRVHRRKKAKKHRHQGKQGKERGPWVQPSFCKFFRMLSTWRRGHLERSDEGEKLEEIPLLVLDSSSDKD